MDGRNSGRVVDLLRRRADLLRAVASSPSEKAELRRSLDVSRSTVNRAIRDLGREELVDRGPGGYRATLYGRLALEAFDAFGARLSALRATTDLLAVLPADAPLAPVAFVDAQVVRPTPTAPQRPVEAVRDLVQWAEEIRGTVVGVSDQAVEIYRRSALDGTYLTLTFTPEALERLLSKYPDRVGEAVSTGRVTIRESTATPPFGLKIHRRGDERVVDLTIYGEEGLRAFVRNDDDEAVRWAESVLAEVEADADRIPLP
jgi:predicted transcriptional regulator